MDAVTRRLVDFGLDAGMAQVMVAAVRMAQAIVIAEQRAAPVEQPPADAPAGEE